MLVLIRNISLIAVFCKYTQQGLFYGHAMSHTKCQSNDKKNNNFFLSVGSILFSHHLFSYLQSSYFGQTQIQQIRIEYILGNNDEMLNKRLLLSFKEHSFMLTKQFYHFHDVYTERNIEWKATCSTTKTNLKSIIECMKMNESIMYLKN